MGALSRAWEFRGKNQIIGREIEEKTLALSMDWKTGFWKCEGDAYELEITDRRQEILDILDEVEQLSLLDIANAVGQDKGNTHRRLQDMHNVGLIDREKKGQNVFYKLRRTDDEKS